MPTKPKDNIATRFSRVNVRSGPSTSAMIVGHLEPGDRATVEAITESINGYHWYDVTYPPYGKRGYVREDVVYTVRENVVFLESGTREPKIVQIKTIHDCGDQRMGVVTVVELNKLIFFAKTLELPDRDNKNNISCIPRGLYPVKWTFSPKFGRNMYLVDSVPNRSGIRLHSAKYVSHLKGCIAFGSGAKDLNKDGLLDLEHSGDTMSEFENLMGQKDFTLIID